MGRIIGRAELLCPPGCQALGLVTPREEGKALGVFFQRFQPLHGRGKRFFPCYLLKLTGATRANALHGRFQARGRIVLHDARRALGAQHALVDRVVAVALDIFDGLFAVLPRRGIDIDAAPAGTHVACGLVLFPDGFGKVEVRLCQSCIPYPKSCRSSPKLANPIKSTRQNGL